MGKLLKKKCVEKVAEEKERERDRGRGETRERGRTQRGGGGSLSQPRWFTSLVARYFHTHTPPLSLSLSTLSLSPPPREIPELQVSVYLSQLFDQSMVVIG